MNENQDMRTSASATEPAGFALSAEWLRALVEQTLAGIYVIQDGRFRYVNQEFANIFGYASSADIIDKLKISELIAPEDREMVAENVRRRAEGEVPEMRYTFVGLRRDGRRIHIEVHGRAMQFDGKPADIGLGLDVSERKLASADQRRAGHSGKRGDQHPDRAGGRRRLGRNRGHGNRNRSGYSNRSLDQANRQGDRTRACRVLRYRAELPG